MKRSLPVFVCALLLLVSCGSSKTVNVGSGGLLGTEKFQFGMPKGGKVVDARYGQEVWFAYGAIAGISGASANGIAISHWFETGKFIHTLQVNIVLPPDGSFYEGWLEDPASGKQISTGHLQSRFGDVRHGLTFESDEDLSKFTNVAISLEKDDGNPAIGKVVAEAKLKQIER
ncbi:MAG: anti-sigma factor [Candidatus Peribacteraceae bacterium]|nr:anti-sigma factor [Candidatus Peribacteraceae bacterium]